MMLYIPNISSLKPIGVGHRFAYTDVHLSDLLPPESEYTRSIQKYIKQKIDDYQSNYCS